MRQTTPTRKHKSIRNANLKVLQFTNQSKKVNIAKISKLRAHFRSKLKKQQKVLKQLTGAKKGKLQKKLTNKKLIRKNEQIKRDILRRKKLLYQRQGGSLEWRGAINTETFNWFDNFFSSNVWKFKMRNNNLMVMFLDGSLYMYFGAGKLFLGMTRTGSKGSYVWAQLRRKNIPFVKML